jgi:hypothetical protein
METRTLRRLVAGLTAGLWVLFNAAPGSALPIDESLTIQPIVVCDTTGANCAVNPTNTAYFSNLQTVMDTAWAQAGIAPVLLSPTTLNIGTVTTSAGRYGLITDVNATAATDGFKLLTRTPGNGQSTNPTTLNLYFVDSLVTPGQIVRGVAYVNGNGFIIADNSVFDTGAHELGHNLGLDHTTFGAGGANNLMTTGGVRTVPTSIANIAPNGANLDQLNGSPSPPSGQIGRARQPLFTVNLGQVDSTPFAAAEGCTIIRTCFNITYVANPSTTETLNNIQLNYGPNVAVNGFTALSANGIPLADVTGSFTTLPGNVVQLTVSLGSGLFGFGDSIDIATFLSGSSMAPPDPISVKFNFKDGFSSQAGFDAVNGAMSGLGDFGFTGVPTYGMNVPTCPLPPTPPPPGAPCGTETSEVDVVPEPSAAPVLAVGLIGLWLVRRRRHRQCGSGARDGL